MYHCTGKASRCNKSNTMCKMLKYTDMNHVSQLRYGEVPFEITVLTESKIQNMSKYKIKKLLAYANLF